MRKPLCFSLIILALWLSPKLALQAANRQQPMRQSQDPTTGAITGVVTDEHGNTLHNVPVWLHRKSDAGVWEYPIEYTYTDPQGRYTLSGLAADVYRIQFHSTYDYRSVFYGQAYTLKSAKDIVVQPGSTSTNIDGRFVRYSGSLQGRVTDQQGQPLEFIWVHVLEDFDQDGEWEALANDATGNIDSTDAAGNYRIADLPDGRYRLRFSDSVVGKPGKYGCGQLRYVLSYYPASTTLAGAQTLIIKKGSNSTT